MMETDAPHTSPTDAESWARSAEFRTLPEVPITRCAAGLSRQISAAQREIEKLDVKLKNARQRDDERECAVLHGQREAMKARRTALQGFLDREL